MRNGKPDFGKILIFDLKNIEYLIKRLMSKLTEIFDWAIKAWFFWSRILKSTGNKGSCREFFKCSEPQIFTSRFFWSWRIDIWWESNLRFWRIFTRSLNFRLNWNKAMNENFVFHKSHLWSTFICSYWTKSWIQTNGSHVIIHFVVLPE